MRLVLRPATLVGARRPPEDPGRAESLHGHESDGAPALRRGRQPIAADRPPWWRQDRRAEREVASGTGGPRLGGGRRPRRITTEQRRRVVTTAEKRPTSLGQPFTRWSVRKPARIEWLLEHEWDLTFAFDEFGPLAIMPMGGSCWAEKSWPQRLRANYHKPYGTRQLFARYSIGADRLHDRIEPQRCHAHPAGTEGHPCPRPRRQAHPPLAQCRHQRPRDPRPRVHAPGHAQRRGPTPVGPTPSTGRVALAPTTVVSPDPWINASGTRLRHDQPGQRHPSGPHPRLTNPANAQTPDSPGCQTSETLWSVHSAVIRVPNRCPQPFGAG